MATSGFFFMPSLVFYLLISCSVKLSAQTQYCHSDEISYLLELKRSFLINSSASLDPLAYFKVDSWKVEEGNCCSWDGVECDEGTGHVIGLDLSSSSLHGSFHPNSSLFRLLFLRRLNLADNHFNFSQIPTTIGNLSRMSYLNLSSSRLSGQIPLEISHLSKLASLDLSSNPDLRLENAKLGRLVRNMSSLQELHLNQVNIASSVPDILANLSSLTSLSLEDCGLYGEFPPSVFQLPTLRFLNLKSNLELRENLPDFQWNSSPLQVLQLARTGFSGELPSSIGNFVSSLTHLDLWSCRFSGSIPSSFSNLTLLTYIDLSNNTFEGEISPLANLTHLQFLALSDNSFNAGDLFWLTKSTKLTHLELEGTNLHDSDVSPSYFANLTQLATLYLRENHLTKIPTELMELTSLTNLDISVNKLSGIIPPQISQLTQMEALCFAYNNLHGPIPSGIFELEHLVYLGLEYNNLTDQMQIDKFFNLKNLTMLHLSANRISLLGVDDNNVAPAKKLHQLGLASCNLGMFPYFLRSQDELEFLDLSINKIHGTVPTWVWNTSRDPLRYMNLSVNFLTGFDQPPHLLPWTLIAFLDLSSNKFQGSLPNPPFSTMLYSVFNNSLSGNISPLMCNMTYLEVIDLSHNNLSGKIPQCFSSFSESLSTVKMHNNKLEGTIPQRWTKGCKLKLINLSQNKLEGELPDSLSNCGLLESVDLSDNKISGNFPYWLGTLPELKVLIMRSNRFSGTIENQETETFVNLQILDLSYNGFTGKVPPMFFKNSSALAFINATQLAYMHSNYMARWDEWWFDFDVFYSMRMINKATMTAYGKIVEWFTAIDLSSNGFEGEIPMSIGNLKSLHLLNLSHNAFTGHIPSTLANISELDALDLSFNKLSGEIPYQLAQLTFLGSFDVSHNNLVGPIPIGNQFGTFGSSSFDGNSGLCGTIIGKKCGVEVAPPSGSGSKGSRFAIDVLWVIVLVGYGGGLIVGVSLEYSFRVSRRFRGRFLRICRRLSPRES